MNGKKTNLRTDTEAVSHVIGVILMMAIFVTMFTLFQASMVPYWNKQVEAGHMPVVYDEMAVLNSDLEDVATLGITKSTDINLGARYPDRMIFRNPGPGAAGTLTVEDDVDVTITPAGEPPQNYKTSRITYELTGMVNSPKLVYEHGIIIREWDDGTVLGPIPPENQSLYDNSTGNIYIPIVNSTSFSMSSLDSKSLSIFPFTDTETNNSPPNTTITLATNYPKVWENLTGSIDNVTVSVPDMEITIKSGTIQQTIIPQIDEGDRYFGALYSGIARFYKVPPSSGNGGGGGFVGPWYSGNGSGSVTDGSLWQNMPSSDTITQFDLTNIVVDGAKLSELDYDTIILQVTDIDGDWWRAQVKFEYKSGNQKITDILVQRKGQTEQTWNYNDVFDISTTIDLLACSHFLSNCYQSANIGPINTLHVAISDTHTGAVGEDVAVKWFNLIIEGS